MTDHTEPSSPTRQFAPLAIIVALPLIFAAIFFYTSPVILETGGDQGIFKCGSPSSPNSDAKNVCDDPEKVARNKAVYSGLAGVVLLGVGAVWLLRGQRRDDEDWDDEGPRRRDDDIDLRDDDADGGRRRGDSLRSGASSRRSRRADDHDDEPLRGAERTPRRGADRDVEADPEVDETRSSRRAGGGRRSVLRDDDFADPEPRRRADDDFADPEPRRRSDDDWSSDGWR